MQFKVITIARTLGAGGEDLGEHLAAELGFRYVDSEIIDRAAAVAGATPEELAKVEARKGLLERILENIGRAGGGGAVAGAGVPPPVLDFPMGPTYEELIVDVIRETADMEFVVIVAHGAAIPLGGRPDVFRILVTASEATRVKRVAKADNVSERNATNVVHESDKSREDFFKRFYHIDRELPVHYDMVLNTDNIDMDHATAAVIAAVRGPR